MKETFVTLTIRRMQLKYDAKRAMPGSWLRAMALTVISLLVTSLSFGYLTRTIDIQALQAENLTYEALLSALAPKTLTTNYLLLAGVSFLLFLLLSAPLRVGSAGFYRAVFRGDRPKLTVALSWFTSFRKIFTAIRLVVWVGVLCFLWGVLCFTVPGGILYISAITRSASLEGIGMMLYFAAWLLFGLRVVGYLPTRFLLAEDPEMGVLACVRRSVELCHGHRFEYLFFEVSFFLWRVAVLFSGMIGSILFEPYYTTASAAFVDSLLNREKETSAVQ